jgi:dCMP deaminase
VKKNVDKSVDKNKQGVNVFSSKKIDRWDNKFLLEATFWSRFSHDQQTKCGCVLVKDKTALSTGYNGFIRNVDDESLPKKRPNKYPFMIHAEANAIYNCTRLGRSTLGATAYITAIPCANCLQALYQCGIKEIVFTDISNPKCVITESHYKTIFGMVSDMIKINYIPASSLDESEFVDCCLEITKKKQ